MTAGALRLICVRFFLLAPFWRSVVGFQCRKLPSKLPPYNRAKLNPTLEVNDGVICPADPWLASDVLANSYYSVPRQDHYLSLIMPTIKSDFKNAFFVQCGRPAIAAIPQGKGDEEEYVAVAHLIPAILTPEACALVTPGNMPEGSCCILQSVAVVPGQRRRGLGTKLVLWAEGAAVERGATDLWVVVREGDLATRGMFEGLGYTVASVKSNNNILIRRALLTARKLPDELRMHRLEMLSQNAAAGE
jgi:GNAT superfamily N-acetyltransferase